MSKLFDLSGKVAIVTGGSRGLGKAMALGLAGAGADLVLSSRSLSACEEVAKEIQALGRRALPFACDMGKWKVIDALVERTYEHFGRCDVLVNNAGVTQSPLPLTETSSEFFDELHAINVKGPMHLASLLAPRMGESGGGSIVNVISAGGLHPVGYLGVYSASKAALNALTRVMAEEWAPLGVRVNAISPGTFLTDMMRELEEITPGFLEHAADQAVQKRVADPDEILGAVLFLASDASSFVTAQTLSVCGGYSW
jgi:NAD(P)-dependent dehydrogenase (short-subunit alcohol dehydrogenase family)